MTNRTNETQAYVTGSAELCGRLLNEYRSNPAFIKNNVGDKLKIKGNTTEDKTFGKYIVKVSIPEELLNTRFLSVKPIDTTTIEGEMQLMFLIPNGKLEEELEVFGSTIKSVLDAVMSTLSDTSAVNVYPHKDELETGKIIAFKTCERVSKEYTAIYGVEAFTALGGIGVTGELLYNDDNTEIIESILTIHVEEELLDLSKVGVTPLPNADGSINPLRYEIDFVNGHDVIVDQVREILSGVFSGLEK